MAHTKTMRVQLVIEISAAGVQVCCHGDVDEGEKPLLAARIHKAAAMLAGSIERCSLLAGTSYEAALAEIRKSGRELPVLEILSGPSDPHTVRVPGPDEVN